MPKLQEIFTGALDAQIPGMGPVMWSVMEHEGIRPQRSDLFTWGPHWALLYVYTATRIELVWTRGKKKCLDIPAGSALLLAPGQRYRVDTLTTPNGGHHAWLVMDGIESTTIAPLLKTHNTYALFQDDRGCLGKALHDLAVVVHAHRRESFWTLQLCSRGILDLLGNAQPLPKGLHRILPPRTSSKSNPLVGRIIEFLHQNLSRRIRLADIAAALGAGPSTISHYYRRATGEAPMKTLMRMRLLRTKVLLIRGHRVSDIAEQLGFCDEHHLAIAFRKAEGVSPRDFLKNRR